MLKIRTILSLAVLTLVMSCRNEDYIYMLSYDNDNDAYDESLVDTDTYPDWTELTHSIAAEPNFDMIFPEEAEVLKIYLNIGSTSWSAMLSDLSSNFSKINNSNYDYTPIWKPCTVTFNDTDWYKVGVRFKGNSSLSTTYSSGNRKLPLKLSFDKYEDDYPALTNQRFYGFKQFSLKNNYNDESLMREKVGLDLFREYGMTSSHASFCALYIDTGSGYDYYGVYTIVEEVDDTVIKEQFADSSANLYKPDGDAASFKSGTYDTSEFDLKTNTSSPDYSDVKALYDALHASNRTSNSSEWQSNLESVFDVDTFLKWLAANATIQNWDTYGTMTHNYYLYNVNGKLTWIPWDYNEAFQSSSDMSKSCIEISSMGSVSSSWPLISYLYSVSEYQTKYKEYLQKFINEVFVTSDMQALYEEYETLLQAWAENEESGRTFFDSSNPASEFQSAVSTLQTHVQSRTTVVNNYLY